MLNIECKDRLTSYCRQPLLIEVDGEKKQTCTYINPIKGSTEDIKIFEMQGKNCVGCFGEWALLIDKRTRECFFLSLTSYLKVNLPPFPESVELFGTFCLTSSPTLSDCITTFVSQRGNFILLCHMHDKAWTNWSITCTSEEFNSYNITHTIYKGRLFLFNHAWKIFVYDFASLIEGRIEMTVSYPFHDYPIPIAMEIYFVESCKSLYLVSIHWFGNGQNITHIEVYRLNELSEEDEQYQEEIHWDYVSSIGDQSFFLSRRYSQCFRAKEVGVEPNCIYITLSCSDGERLYKYCLKDQTFTFYVLHQENKRSFDTELFWTVPLPLPRMQDNEFEASSDILELNKGSVSHERNLNNNKISRRWADLPIDLLDVLFQRLSLVDCLRVTTVCKSWALTSESIPEDNAWPWLMHSPNISNGICKFFDPVNGTEYQIQIDVMSRNEQLAFHSSRDGWVVISEGSDAIFILNPMTEEVIDLPPLDVLDYQYISFVGVPTAPDFRAFAFNFEQNDEHAIYSWHPGHEVWMKTTPEIGIMFYGTINNPVLFNGELYFLDSRGQLGVFNPDKMTWRVLSNPEPMYSDLIPNHHACCTLIELHDDLLVVFRTDNTDPIHVFKLDQSKMAWSKIEDLGDVTLFVGLRNSLASPSPLRSCRNGIFLPKFDGRDHKRGVFYSMDDHMYHPRFYCVEEPITYVWFKPNRTITYKE